MTNTPAFWRTYLAILLAVLLFMEINDYELPGPVRAVGIGFCVTAILLDVIVLHRHRRR